MTTRNRRTTLFAAILLFASLIASASAEEEKSDPAPSEWLVVHAGQLLEVPGKPLRGASTIVVKDGRIERIEDGHVAATELLPDVAPEHLVTLDLTDTFVLPGLMDMHVHLSFNPDRAPATEYGTSDDYVKEHRSVRDDSFSLVTAIDNANKTLQAGFTTVRNIGSYGWHIYALRDGINDGKLTGPRILTAGHIIRVGADSGAGACSGVESCRLATRTQIDMGADLIKVYGTCSGSKPCGTQNAPPVFLPDEIQAVIEAAASRELKVAVHAHGTAGIRLAVESGATSIEHGSYNDAETRALMKKKGTFLVPTLSVQDRIRKEIETASGPMVSVMQSFLDNHFDRTQEAFRAGVRIAAGSDAGVVEHGNNARELEAYVELGMTPEEAIVTATIHAAELIGRSKDLGSIEVGKLADMIAVADNPLEDIAALKHVRVVVKDGKVVKNEL